MENMNKIWKINFIDGEDSRIKFTVHTLDDEEPIHEHEFIEIEYIAKGKIMHSINFEEEICNEGDFLFFYVGDKHAFKTVDETSIIINIAFDPKILGDMLLYNFIPMDKKIKNIIKLPEEEKKHCVDILYFMQQEDKNRREGYVRVLHGLLQVLVCILMRYGEYKEKYDDRIKQIIQNIEENPLIDIVTLSEKAGYCKDHVSRIFKDAVGMTVKEYINKKKMLKAYELLKNSNLSIEKIMEIIGIYNKTHFYNKFKKEFGKTPGEARKRM